MLKINILSTNYLLFCLRKLFGFSFSICSPVSSLLLAIMMGCGVAQAASASQIPQDSVKPNNGLSMVSVVSGLPSSWGLKAAPNQTLYVSHRAGALARYTYEGELLALYELALSDLHQQGQGGLSAIAFHPDFLTTPWIYLSYSFGTDAANGLKVIRVLLSDPQSTSASIVKTETIFTQKSLRSTSAHYGARLVFMNDNSLLISTGDGFDFREDAQRLDSQLGKILRVTDTGNIPDDNPYADAKGKNRAYVYSVGHRNPQGLIVLNNNQVVSSEHGPDGGDEVNFIEPGKNYGWPVITLGKDYIGSQITPFTEYPNMQQPAFNWTPSIAPSGMVYYTQGPLIPLRNKLLLSSLKYQQLHAFNVAGKSVNSETVYFAKSGFRMRDITVSSDGRLFVLSDGAEADIFELVMAQ